MVRMAFLGAQHVSTDKSSVWQETLLHRASTAAKVAPLHQKEASSSSYPAKLAERNLISPLESDRQEVAQAPSKFCLPFPTAFMGFLPDGYLR